MLENDESFIYIKNDDEVNLKTDRFQTDPNNVTYNNPFQKCDLSDSRILTFENEFYNRERAGKTNDIENNNLHIDNLGANNNLIYNRNGTASLMKNTLVNNNYNVQVSGDNLNSEKNILRNSKIKKSYIEEEGPKIISLDEVPMFRKLFIQVHPFILNGYRIHHEIKDCFFSVFKLHNETLNIWTHMMPFIGFLVLLTYLFITHHLDFKNGGLIYLFVFFSTILFLFSTLYHIMNCHSNEVCACCYKLDLMGIMFELISATIASLYYMFHEYDTLKKIYIYLFLIIGVLTILISLFDYFISAKLNLFLMLLYASLFLMSFLSCLHWSIIANINEVKIISKYVLCGYLSLFTGFIFFFAKFPESCYQSKTVDYFFQSHSIWHISTSLCVLFYYLMLYNYYQLLYAKPVLVK